MTNNELNLKLTSLVRAERALTHEILALINQVEARGLHIEMGYSSLFYYLTKFLGYCESSAYRRMQAARLLREIPSIEEKLVSGKIQLTQMAKVQSAARAQSKPVSTAEKHELVRALEGRTLAETKELLAKKLPERKTPRQITYARDHINVTLRLSSEQFTKLQTVKELLSHAVPSGSLEEILEKLCEEKIRAKTALRHVPKISQAHGRSHINTNLRKAVFAKHNYECQYKSGSRHCKAKRFLELEHIQPLAHGGSNAPENLTVLCRAHNSLRAKQAGLS